ncbi:MAG: DUF4149 domain-containing protein [Verrucomicrobiota bacterium]
MNAAIWFGSAIFLVAGIGPAFHSEEMTRLLPRIHGEAAYQILATRLFLLQTICAGVALAHLFMEWLYSGRPVPRSSLYVLLVAGFLSVAGAYGIQPHLQQLHLQQHGVKSTTAQRSAAAQSFALWQRVSQGMHLVVTLGVAYYLWRLSVPTNGGGRFSTTHKFRG